MQILNRVNFPKMGQKPSDLLDIHFLWEGIVNEIQNKLEATL
jgi:hypothetical protein